MTDATKLAREALEAAKSRLDSIARGRAYQPRQHAQTGVQEIDDALAALSTAPGESGDWPEDAAHENGNYSNICRHCSRVFIGYKRRIVCKSCAATAPGESEGARDERLFWFLTVLAGADGEAPSSDEKYEWVNTFCDDRPGETDTFNLALEQKLTRYDFDSMFEHGTVYLTDAGREWLTRSTPPTAPGKAGIAAEVECERLREALREAKVWHERRDKELSESGRADADYYWRRDQHRDQIEEIDRVLAGDPALAQETSNG